VLSSWTPVPASGDGALRPDLELGGESSGGENRAAVRRLKARRLLIRVLVINDNSLWINDFI